MAVKRNLFTTQVYTIDMSSLKELHDRYPKNLFPTIWERINLAIAETQLYSHVEVLREIRNTTNPQDKLLKWGNKHRKLFVGIDNCQRNQIHQIRTKYNPSHWQNKMNRPAPWADPYLIAMAVCEQAVIVTQEHKTKNERIPPIANQFGITSLNLLEFFQALKIKL